MRVELWQIGDSECAPKFQVIPRPDDRAKAVLKATIQFARSSCRRMQIKRRIQFEMYASGLLQTERLRVLSFPPEGDLIILETEIFRYRLK